MRTEAKTISNRSLNIEHLLWTIKVRQGMRTRNPKSLNRLALADYRLRFAIGKIRRRAAISN